MQQYQLPAQRPPTVPVATEANIVEQRLVNLVNRLAEQNALQARQIRRLESDVTVLRETVNSRTR